MASKTPYFFKNQIRKPNPKLVEQGTPMLKLPFALSYSKISEWYQCPTKFYANYLTEEIKFQDTPQTLLGKAKHKALEEYGLYGITNPILEPHEYDLVTKIRAVQDAVVLYEEQGIFGFTSIEFDEVVSLQKMWDKQSNGSKFFLIGQADLICVTGRTAVIVDHKSGKQKSNWEKNYETDKLRKSVENGNFQMQLYALFVFLKFPEVSAVKCILNYLKDNAQIPKIYTRAELPALQLTAKQICQHIEADYARFVNFKDKYTPDNYSLMQEHSERYGRESGLCSYCGYRDKCIKYKKKSTHSQKVYDVTHPSQNINTPREPLSGELLLVEE